MPSAVKRFRSKQKVFSLGATRKSDSSRRWFQLNPEDLLNDAMSQVCADNSDAMRSIYDATSRKVFGVIVSAISDSADQRTAMRETYVSIWERRRERSGMTNGHLIWILAIARRHTLKFKTMRTETLSTNDARPVDRSLQPPTSIGQLSYYKGARLSQAEQAILVDAYLKGDGPSALQTRYNLEAGQLVPELKRIIRHIRETAK